MKIKLLILGVLLVSLVALALPSPKTGAAMVSWLQDYMVPPNPDIYKINVYYWASNSPTISMVSVATSPTAIATNCAIYGLTRGTNYFFYVTSATENAESDPSQTVTLYIPKKPGSPTNAAVKLN